MDVQYVKCNVTFGMLRISFLFILLFLLCGEEDPPDPPGNPYDMQYTGTLSGNTNEGLLVIFYIDSINQWTRVERAVINFYRDSGKLSMFPPTSRGWQRLRIGDL